MITLGWVDKFDGSFAITMPKQRAASKLPIELASNQISTYAHTVNSAKEAKMLLGEKGVSELYTDFLRPLYSENSAP